MPVDYHDSTYNAWRNMRQRCNRRTHPQFDRYGGRGITVCQRWDSFEAFRDDMGPRPSGLTLERVRNEKGYYPGNCIWATQGLQNRNTRRTHIIELNGKRQCLTDWAAEHGLHPMTVWSRMQLGLSFAEALAHPLQQGRKFHAL